MPLDAYGRLTLFTARYEDNESIGTLTQNEFRSLIDRAFRFFKLCCERPDLFIGQRGGRGTCGLHRPLRGNGS